MAAAGEMAIGEAIIMDIGTIIPVGIGIATATIIIGTIRATMTGTAQVVTMMTMMIDAAAM